MNLVIVHRHFWPSDLPYSQMLREFALSVIQNGHTVTVVAPCETRQDLVEREKWSEESKIRTVSKILPGGAGLNLGSKATLYIRYVMWVAKTLLKLQPDVIWVATTPPVVTATVVRHISRIKKCQYIYHCQDIHPEASISLGVIKSKLLVKLLKYLDKKNVKEACHVVVLSNDMKRTLLDRKCGNVKISVVNNFFRENLNTDNVHQSKNHIIPDLPVATTDSSRNTTKKWLFAGTLGYFQNLELIVQSLGRIESSEGLEVTFMGNGANKAKLEQLVKSNNIKNVKFIDAVDSETAQSVMSEYDVGIVSLHPGVINSAYPSKVINYLAAGLKIFSIVEKDSELGEFIVREKLGFVSEPDSVESLASDIKCAIRVDALKPDSDRCIKIANSHFGAEYTLGRYNQILASEIN